MADRAKGDPYDGDHGRRLASQYETVLSEALYGALMPGLPKAPASIPDIELRVGARLSGERAHALHRVLRDCATTITRMPATYITYPGTSEAIFPARRFRTIQSRDVLELDEVYLWSFGEEL